MNSTKDSQQQLDTSCTSASTSTLCRASISRSPSPHHPTTTSATATATATTAATTTATTGSTRSYSASINNGNKTACTTPAMAKSVEEPLVPSFQPVGDTSTTTSFTGASTGTGTTGASASIIHTQLHVPSQRRMSTKIQPQDNTIDDAHAQQFNAQFNALQQYHYPNDNHKMSKPRNPISSCPLLCVFYAEFDNETGPTICYQSPTNFMECDIDMSYEDIDDRLQTFFEKGEEDNGHAVSSSSSSGSSSDSSGGSNANTNTNTNANTNTNTNTNTRSIFNSTSEYIITKNETLTGQIISLSTHNMHILSFPVIIKDAEKYKGEQRSTFFFSVGFVIRRLVDPIPFRPILSKLTSTFETMEIESGYLSNNNNNNNIHNHNIHNHNNTTRKTNHQLQTVLDGILSSLNSPSSECHMLLNDANILHLQYFRPPRVQGPIVPDYVVPVLLVPQEQLKKLNIDLTIDWILQQHIDGIKPVKLISDSSGVDLEAVRASLRVLRHHHAIACVDIFRFQNVYVCTEKAQRMLASICGGGFDTADDSDELKKLLKGALDFVFKREMPSSPHTSQLNVVSAGGSRARYSNLGGSGGTLSGVASPHRYRSTSWGSGVGNDSLISPRDGTFSQQRKGSGSIVYTSSPRSGSLSITSTNQQPPPLSTSLLSTSSHISPPSSNLSKTMNDKTLMKALAILYVSCQKGVTILDICEILLSTDEKKKNSENGVTQNDDKPKEPTKTFTIPLESYASAFSSDGEDSKTNKNKIDWKEVIEKLYKFGMIPRFVTFGVIHGLIKRVHEYPIAYDAATENSDEGEINDNISEENDNDEYSFKQKAEEDSMRQLAVNNRSTPRPLSQHNTPYLRSSHSLSSARYVTHPIPPPSTPSATSRSSSVPSTREERKKETEIRETKLAREIAAVMDGLRCDDELLCMFQRPIEDIKALVQKKTKKIVVSIYQ